MSRRLLGIAAVLSLLACGDTTAFTADDYGDVWLTEADLRIGPEAGEDLGGGFAPVSDVRILADGERILVAEAAIARATIWSPDGSLIREVGGLGEGPGQFSGMFFVQPHSDGFHARDVRRFTSFSGDGGFIETIRFPPPSMSFRGFGLTPEALLPDGSVLAVPAVPPEIMMGARGDDPIESLPVLRLWERAGRWTADTVAVLNFRNHTFIVGESVLPVGVPIQQFYGDYDLTWFDPVAASVVVVGRAGGNGTLELAEINADGDTVWHRRLALPAVEPTPESTAHLIEALAGVVPSRPDGTVDAGFRRRIREQVEDDLYVPNPLPAAWVARGTASGEIWLRTFEDVDTLVAWYAVRKGEDGRVRRVLLPRGFDAKDATDTHVWGIRKDELGVDHVLGHRLVGSPDRAMVAAHDEAAGSDPGTGAWTTRVDHRIEDTRNEGEGFDRFTLVRVGAGGTRVVTTDGIRSGVVRVWAPDGELLLSVGSDEQRTATFLGVRADSRRFRVTDFGTGRTAVHSFDGEGPTDTLHAPAGFESYTPTSRGGFVGSGSLPHWEDFAADPASRTQAKVHVTPTPGGVRVDTITMIDRGHANWYVAIGDRTSGNPGDHSVTSITQPFRDHDLTWSDEETGSVGVVRRSGTPGEVEVFQVATTGDTTWHRRLSLPAIPVPDADATQAVEGNFEHFRRVVEDGGLDVTVAELRSIAETVVHVPSHLPAVTDLVAAASGEIWFETPEVEGELSVWYSIRAGERDSAPRRVLIPSGFRLMDAFGDHVWGLANESDGTLIVQGLRLVPPPS